MCNAWNHPADCDCGFGGDTDGGGWGWYSPPTVYSWEYRDDDFCLPTSCPICGASVYFVRHNGGSVWFDDLGPPWPKHVCFDDEVPAQSLRIQLAAVPKSIFGVVIETKSGAVPRIVVRCSDGCVIDCECDATWDLEANLGKLIILERHPDGRVTLRLVA
jgi:hypothetical protein